MTQGDLPAMDLFDALILGLPNEISERIIYKLSLLELFAVNVSHGRGAT